MPAGQSNHQKGIAIDVRARNYSWLHSEIEKFGGIRHLTITNIDPNHIEAIQGSAQCGTPGYQPSDPSSVANTPTSDIANAIRNVLGMNTQSPASPPPPPPAQASQPQPLPPSAQPTLAPAPVTDQTLPINPAPVALPAGSVQVGSNAPDHMPTSTFDLIDQYVNPPNSAPDVATSAPVHLNQNIGDTATGLVPAPSGTESTGMAATQGPPAQQTFTSSDLAQSALPARNGFLGRWLDTLQGTLWYALNYLKPFRGVSPLQHVE